MRGSINHNFRTCKPGTVGDQTHWLPHLLYTFIGVMTWPIILAEPFIPGVEEALLDPDGYEEDTTRSEA